MTNWQVLIAKEMGHHGETLDDTVRCTPPLESDEMSRMFDDSYGLAEGCPFTLWTSSRIYFPAVYDGAEWVASVPRRPCTEVTKHVGGQ